MICPTATEMVSKLEGLSVWQPLAGPCGITLEFGTKHIVRGILEEGTFSLWAKCEIKVSGKGVVFFARSWPTKQDQAKFNELLVSSAVLKADIDDRNNSLRLLLGKNKLLSVYPPRSTQQGCWLLYDHTEEPTRRCLATAQSIEVTREKE
jgi:hypothetical protein